MKSCRGKQVLRKIGLAVGMLLIGWLSPGMGSAASPKVDVCHRALNGSFHLITIAYQAVQAHRNHGDALPGEAVPGKPGSKFDATCTEVVSSNCPCDFSLSGLAALGIDGEVALGPQYCAPPSGGYRFIQQRSAVGTCEVVAATGIALGPPDSCGTQSGDCTQVLIQGLTSDQLQHCVDDLQAAAVDLGLTNICN